MNKRGEILKKLYEELNRDMVKKSIISLVDDSKMTKRINYSPNYQRNYIWSDCKAIKLIETILLNREVPPLTAIEKEDSIEIIDGRQRYETILRFFNDKFKLKAFGLSVLKPLDNLRYSELPQNLKSIFDEYRLKFIMYKVEKGVKLGEQEVEHIKRDLFRRYNYGMTALKKSEVARAKYLYDDLTNLIRDEFLKNDDVYKSYVELYLPVTKRNLNDRDKINLLLVTSRELLSIPYIPIIGVKSVKFGSSNIEKYYETFVKKENITDKKNEFFKISQKLLEIKNILKDNSNILYNNILFLKSVYWMLSILYKYYPSKFYDFNVHQFNHYLESENNALEYFNNYKNLSSDHIINRHTYLKNYITNILNLDSIFEDLIDNRHKVIYKPPEKLKNTDDWYGIKNNDQITTIPEKFSISEIVELQKKDRFIIRSVYQRGEVPNVEKASRIIESLILGIKLPPIYAIIKINDLGLKEYTIIDGQQRLLSILKFMGEQVLDENKDFIKTFKNNYKLTGLKDLNYLNGKKYSGDNSISENDRKLISNYEIDIIQIEEKNKNFDPVDMFLRLNENPCTISKNSFEMWNSFEIINTINNIKRISKHKFFNQKKGKTMKEEELVTILAFIDKEKLDLDNCNKFFKIHLYTENKDKSNERIEIKMSILNKSMITNYLEDLDFNSDDEEQFNTCLNNVELFIKKLEILVKDDYNQLIKLVNPYVSNPCKVSMKDFYLLWLILNEFDNHFLTTYRLELLNELLEVFKLMKNMPLDKDVNYFFGCIKNMINKFVK